MAIQHDGREHHIFYVERTRRSCRLIGEAEDLRRFISGLPKGAYIIPWYNTGARAPRDAPDFAELGIEDFCREHGVLFGEITAF